MKKALPYIIGTVVVLALIAAWYFLIYKPGLASTSTGTGTGTGTGTTPADGTTCTSTGGTTNDGTYQSGVCVKTNTDPATVAASVEVPFSDITDTPALTDVNIGAKSTAAQSSFNQYIHYKGNALLDNCRNFIWYNGAYYIKYFSKTVGNDLMCYYKFDKDLLPASFRLKFTLPFTTPRYLSNVEYQYHGDNTGGFGWKFDKA